VKANLMALDMRTKAIHDSINYFPPSANRACRIGFYAQQGSRAMSWDEVEMSDTRACLGRVYFKVPGGIQYGPALAETCSSRTASCGCRSGS